VITAGVLFSAALVLEAGVVAFYCQKRDFFTGTMAFCGKVEIAGCMEGCVKPLGMHSAVVSVNALLLLFLHWCGRLH
jgi:hypothetical protein